MRKVERALLAAQKRLVTIGANALLIDAARLLNSQEVNLVVVCDDSGRMAGVITKTDVVRRISQCTGASCTTAASNVMTPDVVFCRPNDRLHDIWSTMKQRGLKNIPVLDENSRPFGVLNARDALQVLLEDVQYEQRLLRDYVIGIGYR